LDVQKEVLNILDEALNLDGRAAAMGRDSALLGAVPELDSIAVVRVITTLEERFGFMIADDEVDAATFASVGALADFVQTKLAI
jgi:acyl carrier protein